MRINPWLTNWGAGCGCGVWVPPHFLALPCPAPSLQFRQLLMSVVSTLVKCVGHRWWGLFACIAKPPLPFKHVNRLILQKTCDSFVFQVSVLPLCACAVVLALGSQQTDSQSF